VIALFRLTSIELDTLKQLAAGLTVPQAAKLRWVSIDTVKTQRRRLYAKMDVPNGYLAVARGYHWGILDPDVPPELALEQHKRYDGTWVEPTVSSTFVKVDNHRGPLSGKANRAGGQGAEVQPEEERDLTQTDDLNELYRRFPALRLVEDRAGNRLAR
jgi:DNA-binding CsgD family transcriptional regulator